MYIDYSIRHRFSLAGLVFLYKYFEEQDDGEEEVDDGQEAANVTHLQWDGFKTCVSTKVSRWRIPWYKNFPEKICDC